MNRTSNVRTFSEAIHCFGLSATGAIVLFSNEYQRMGSGGAFLCIARSMRGFTYFKLKFSVRKASNRYARSSPNFGAVSWWKSQLCIALAESSPVHTYTRLQSMNWLRKSWVDLNSRCGEVRIQAKPSSNTEMLHLAVGSNAKEM